MVYKFKANLDSIFHWCLTSHSVVATFKTVPVVATTTAKEVIKVALQKFGLKVCDLHLTQRD